MESSPSNNSLYQGKPRATAAMVAAMAGVSTATVSLVASGKTAGRVSALNIAKVQAAITELGYVVDSIGSSLASGRSNIVILVAPDVSNPFFADVVKGAREAMGQHFQLLLAVTDAGQTPQSSEIRKLFALRPAGFLIDAPSAEFLAELCASSPMVLLDAAGLDSPTPAINFDLTKGSRELAAHLAEQGHRNVAYFDSLTDTETFVVRREAFSAAAKNLGLNVLPDLIQRANIDVGAAAHSFATALPMLTAKGVSAVVCCTDTHAYGVLQEARVAGINIPDQLAVSGFDDLPYSASSSPGLTTVHLSAMDLGLMAGARLRRLIEGTTVSSANVILPSTLVIRGSTLRAAQ